MANPRKPRAQKIVEGTFRKDRNPEHEPEFVPVYDMDMKPPSDMNKWGKKFWREHLQPLSEVLTVEDLPAFHQLCRSWGAIMETDWVIHHDENKKKRTRAQYRKSRNYMRSRMPEVMEQNEASERFNKLANQFGMTPSSRNKIDLKDKKNKTVDPMEKLLAEGDS